MNARAAVLTGAGRGAVAVIVVWGDDAMRCLDLIFRPIRGRSLFDTPVGMQRLGRIGDGLGDEVLAVRLEDPSCVELQCHGGPAAVALVVDALQHAGVRVGGSYRWLKYALGTRIEAQATWLQSRAQTLRVAAHLQAQAEGALRRELLKIQALMRSLPVERQELLDRVEALGSRGAIGSRLLSGWTIALAGRPNVGKSALLNQLLGFERAIVAATAGTTRDVVTASAAIDGWPVTFADTAGVRATDDEIESAGVARALRQHESSDLVILVLDRSEALFPGDRELIGSLPNAVIVANKSDLINAWPSPLPGAIEISAATGAGIARLVSVLVDRLVTNPPAVGEAIPFRPVHERVLTRAIADATNGHWDDLDACLRSLLK